MTSFPGIPRILGMSPKKRDFDAISHTVLESSDLFLNQSNLSLAHTGHMEPMWDQFGTFFPGHLHFSQGALF